MIHTRRRFLMGMGALAGVALPVIGQATTTKPATPNATAEHAATPKPKTLNADAMATIGLLHSVYFWLKNPDSAADKASLIAGLQRLSAIPSVRNLQIGVPASTEQRDVVDNSFQVSELMMFDDVAGQNAYQVHPLHQQFVAECAHLWQRVVVFDSQLV